MHIVDVLWLYLLLEAIARGDSQVLKRARRLTTALMDEQTVELGKYAVSIRSRNPQIIFGDNHYCMGAIIAPQFVITGAICTMSASKVRHRSRSIVIVAGTPNRLRRNTNTVTKYVEKLFVPENYTQYKLNNIAVIKVKGRWPSDNPSIGIISLPSAKPDYEVDYMVLGWGRLYRGGPLAANLVHIYVRLISTTKCVEILKSLSPEMLCASNSEENSEHNPCAGDTGAPMIFNRTLVGIVSYRLGCGLMGMPSIYTDVWYHIDWITEVLDSGACLQRGHALFSLVAALMHVAVYV